MPHLSVERQHLVGLTTFYAYFEKRVGKLHELPASLREKLEERERRLSERIQPGDELFEWRMTDDESGESSGLAIVRDGVIVWAELCTRSVCPEQAAQPGTPTARRFYEGDQPALTGQLQLCTFQSQVHTPLRPEGVMKRMVIDPLAPTMDIDKPAFMTPPPGAKAYHGFPLLEQTTRDGWRLGAITDPFEADTPEGCTIGDLFVEAPDGSRAGVVWNSDPQLRFAVVEPPDEGRWGLFHFTFSRPLCDIDDLEEMFEQILPVLRQLYTRFHPEHDGR